MGDEMQEGLTMGTEVERKFLVVGKAWKTAPGSLVRQGYLNRDPKRTVRIRVDGEKAWITVKGITIGATRSEFEYRIPRKDADALLQLCEAPLVEKTRRRIKHAGHLWEVDEFYGDNAGLVVAEVELKHESDTVKLPLGLARKSRTTRAISTPISCSILTASGRRRIPARPDPSNVLPKPQNE